MKRRNINWLWKVLVSAMLVGTLCVGCGSEKETAKEDAAEETVEETAENAEKQTADDNTYRVGFVTYADSDSSIQAMVETLEEGLESDELKEAIGADKNIEYIQIDGKADGATQQAGVETLLTQDVDIVLMYGATMPSNTNCVKLCNEAGVPIVLVGSDAEEGDYYYVGFQDKDLGIAQGKFVCDNLEENATVCYLSGAPEQENAQNRKEGTLSTIKELRPDIEILAEQTGNWLTEEAMRVTEDWIQAYEDIDCIVVADNKMTQGVSEALKAAGMQDEVMVVGVIHLGSWDAQMVADGNMTAGVYVGFPVLGDYCVEEVKKIYLGEEIEPRVNIDMYDITADNYAEFFG